MIPGRASAALIPNRPNRDAEALSLFIIDPFKPFPSLSGGSPPLLMLWQHRLVIMLQQVPQWPSR